MHKLECYVIEFLQYTKMMESLDSSKNLNRYIELEDELLILTKGYEDREIIITTECNIHNMESTLIRCVKLIDNHYKVIWSDIFRYLIGELNESEVLGNPLTNELRMLRLSDSPLSNYLRTK